MWVEVLSETLLPATQFFCLVLRIAVREHTQRFFNQSRANGCLCNKASALHCAREPWMQKWFGLKPDCMF